MNYLIQVKPHYILFYHIHCLNVMRLLFLQVPQLINRYAWNRNIFLISVILLSCILCPLQTIDTMSVPLAYCHSISFPFSWSREQEKFLFQFHFIHFQIFHWLSAPPNLQDQELNCGNVLIQFSRFSLWVLRCITVLSLTVTVFADSVKLFIFMQGTVNIRSTSEDWQDIITRHFFTCWHFKGEAEASAHTWTLLLPTDCARPTGQGVP
jgi:hypothetical protein